MGLFDSLAKQAMGSLLGGNDPSSMLTGLLNQAGGMNGLKDKFQEAGMGETFASWVGTGENQAVQPSQLQNILGSEAIQDLASKIGLDVRTVLPLLSQYLPMIIDKLTPNGSIENTHPSADQLQNVLASVMKGGLGGLFGGGKA